MTANVAARIASVGKEHFRAVMSEVCSPVTVITSIEDGVPHGTTVSAFASLSLEPPMVSVALDRGSDLLRMVRRSRRIGVNVLAQSQRELAVAFARKGGDKFAGVQWTSDSGLPRLTNAAGWLACEVEELVAGGDHVILLAHVTTAAVQASLPLTYHRRGYGTHTPFEAWRA